MGQISANQPPDWEGGLNVLGGVWVGWGVAESHPQRTAFKGSYVFRICHRWAGSLLSLSASGQNLLLGLRSMLAFHDPTTLTSLWGSALSFFQSVLPAYASLPTLKSSPRS